MASFENSFHKEISRYQEGLLEEAKQFVCGWLSQQDNFEEAADWLFGDDSNSLFQDSKGTFAFSLVAYAIEAFNDWSDEQPDEDEEEDEGEENDEEEDSSAFYDRVREYFDC